MSFFGLIHHFFMLLSNIPLTNSSSEEYLNSSKVLAVMNKVVINTHVSGFINFQHIYIYSFNFKTKSH